MAAKRKTVAARGGCVSVLFIVFGVGFVLIYGVPVLRKAYESWNWTSTQGKIIRSRVEIDERSHFPKVVHQYEVNGKSYESDTIWIGSDVGIPSRPRARDIVKRYPVGREVTVYYDPAAPQQAVLQRGVHATSLFHVYFGGAFFGIGLLVFLLRNAVARCVVPSDSPIVRNS